jgi:hypothetical protein
MLPSRTTALPAFGLALAVAAGLLAGCNSDNTVSPGNCGTPSGPLALAYPAPGSTSIPDNFIGVILATQTYLPSSYQALLGLPGASVLQPLQPVGPVPTELPSPFKTPGFANPVYQTSSSGGFILPAHSKITVFLNDLYSNCTPSQVGSFTSQ